MPSIQTLDRDYFADVFNIDDLPQQDGYRFYIVNNTTGFSVNQLTGETIPYNIEGLAKLDENQMFEVLAMISPTIRVPEKEHEIPLESILEDRLWKRKMINRVITVAPILMLLGAILIIYLVKG